jgi:hypothetical protein
MTAEPTKEPESNPAETEYLAGTPQFEEMKRMAIEGAKARLRDALKSSIKTGAEKRSAKSKSTETLASRSAPILETFASMMDMPLEEQALTQFACMTQSGMDCMIRASAFEDDGEEETDRWSRRKPAPASAKRTQRHAELEIQARMAASSSLLLDALTRMRNNGCHQITFSHLQPAQRSNQPAKNTVPAPPAEKPETVEERAERVAEMGVKMCFEGMSEAFDGVYPPSPRDL